MGIFDKINAGLAALNEGVKTASKYVDNYVDEELRKRSNDQLLDAYNRSNNDRFKEKCENELRDRGYSDFNKSDDYDY